MRAVPCMWISCGFYGQAAVEAALELRGQTEHREKVPVHG